MSAYQSTLFRRTRDVSEEDFQWTYRDKHVQKRHIGKDTLTYWNKHIPYMPSQLTALYTADLPALANNLGDVLQPDFDFCVSHDKPPVLYMTLCPQEIWAGKSHSYKPGGYKLLADYDVINHRMYSVSDMKVDDKYQGQGTGRILIRGMMEMAMALDFPRFDFGMGGNGAYTWSRMGGRIDVHADIVRTSCRLPGTS